LLIGWEYSSQKTKCIDATTAKEWDKLLGRPAYHDKVNSLECIAQQRLNAKVDEKEKGLYVEAPHQGREFIANGALENGAFCTVFSENFHKF
jgi:hypothetical protein